MDRTREKRTPFIPYELASGFFTADRWDRHFLDIAFKVSEMSKDPSTKCGAVIVRPDRSICSTGFNGFPRGMPDDEALYADRNEKYSRVVHCEVNALMFAREPVHGCTLYTTPFLSCDRCCVQMIQAGITRFVAPAPTDEQTERWGDAWDRTKKYILECGLSYCVINDSGTIIEQEPCPLENFRSLVRKHRVQP